MAESPTPETGTPESQSPARTPPALITTEELLQSIVAKSPEVPTPPFEPSPSGSVSRRAPMDRYEFLRAADAGHRLQGLRLPPEEELRAAALGGRLAVGPPPRLPHQLSPALQSVLLGWRSVYESCSKASELQALVGECYAREAVFEDPLVSARGQESVYRQFAILGAALRSVQVAAYSLSVAPLWRPKVRLEPPRGAEFTPEAQATAPSPSKVLPPQHLAQPQPQPQRPSIAQQWPQPQTQLQRVGLQEISILSRQQQQEQESEAAVQRQQVQLHLTRVTVENVQRFELGLPPLLTWLVGGKARGLQIHLYVTSILLVASDMPLAVSGSVSGGGSWEGGEWPTDLTASRLAGAAAALGRDSAAATATAAAEAAAGVPGELSSTPYGGAAGRGPRADSSAPCWRIVHHVDIWHNVPLVWWRLRRALCVAMDALLGPLLRV
ncbi:hypothetical protein VaNZ11_009073 [Volvox africanus]|uniref:Uncharacterized protein n=1 Tax=Volvox africanus TaxID=51714 RepID=A0ABQ5S7W1_9CHLO|nr:hypothetical protein VaNZ11_009073 [Volvox africanus]